MYPYYKVLLPERIWNQHRGSPKKLLFGAFLYIKDKYPDYVVVKVEDGFIVCKKKGELV